MAAAEDVMRVVREVYLPPVMRAIREVEAGMSPEVRAFLAGLPNGGVWEDLRRQRELREEG